MATIIQWVNIPMQRPKEQLMSTNATICNSPCCVSIIDMQHKHKRADRKNETMVIDYFSLNSPNALSLIISLQSFFVCSFSFSFSSLISFNILMHEFMYARIFMYSVSRNI